MSEYESNEDYLARKDQEDMDRIRFEWNRKLDLEEELAIRKLYQQACTTKFRRMLRKGDFESDKRLERFKQFENQYKDPIEKEQTEYKLVTVNPQSTIELSELQKKVDKYTKRKIVAAAEWCYEQRSPDPMTAGYGPHCHIIVKKQSGLLDSAFNKYTRSTFADLVKNPKQAIDIQNIKPEWVKDKRSYLQDIKTGEGKAEKQEVDKVWRRENNLKDYYKTHIPLECQIINLQEDQPSETPL